MKRYLPRRRIYLSWTTGQHFVRALPWRAEEAIHIKLHTSNINQCNGIEIPKYGYL